MILLHAVKSQSKDNFLPQYDVISHETHESQWHVHNQI